MSKERILKQKKSREKGYTTSEDIGGLTFSEMARIMGKGNASSMRYQFYRALEKVLDGLLEYQGIDYKKMSKEKKEDILRSSVFQNYIKDSLITFDMEKKND